MIAANRLSLCVAVLCGALAVSACSSKKPVVQDAGTDAGACLSNNDCPDPVLFYCNATTGQCDPSCHDNSQCSAAGRGMYPIAYCATSLGCVCDDGLCVAAQCSADSDCGTGTVCRNGGCVTAPAPSSVTSCILSPDEASTTKGSTVTFWVSLFDNMNNPVVLSSGITWTSLDAAMTVSGTPGGSSATFNAVAVSTASTGVQAAVGSATCQAHVAIYDPAAVTAGTIQAVVTDELTGHPVQGAVVVASDPRTGGIVGTAQTTDANGLATVTSIATGVNVSVFHDQYGYLTVANYKPTATGATNVVSLVIRRNPTDLVGGFTGTFNDLPMAPNILVGLTGMSIAGTITDLDVTQILGASVPTLINIPGLIDNKTESLPAGVYLQYQNMSFKPTDWANGLAGVCTDTFAGGAGQAAPLIAAGQCGTRSAWGLAANLEIGDVSGIFMALTGGGSSLNIGTLLPGLIPVFKKFNSSVGRDVQFKLKVPDGGTDISGYTAYDNDFQQTPLGFQYVATVPALRQFQGTYPDTVIALALAHAPGRGVVPLGLGAGTNTMPQDTEVDPETVGPNTTLAGQIFIREAPAHEGLEGDPYSIVLLSLSASSFSTGLQTSALLTRLPGNKLIFDPAGATPVPLQGPFMDLPFNIKCNFSSTLQPGLPARTCTFSTSPDLTGVSMVRFAFGDAYNHRWVVIADPADIAAGIADGTGLFTLPTPPTDPATSMPFEDRLLYDSAANAQRSTLLAQMLGLNSDPANGGSALSFQNVVQLGSTNADRLTDFTTAFSIVDYKHPGLKWTTPGPGGGTLTHGQTVTVQVSNFNVGTSPSSDGIVHLSFAGTAAGCATTTATGTSADSSGNVNIVLPSTCLGSGITMTAALYDNEASPQPLNPPVSQAVTVTIN